MQQDEQAAWDEAKRQAALDEDHSTIPFLPASELPATPYSDPTVAYPQGFQSPQYPYEQNAYGQSSLPPAAGNTGYPDLPQGPVYQGAVPPMLPPVPPSGPVPKPEKPHARRLLIASLVVLVLIFLGMGGFLLLPVLAAGNHSQTTVASVPTPASTPAVTPTQPAAKNIYTPYLTQYRAGIRDQIAQGLHLTSAQLGAQLAAGKTLSSIATTQGLSSAQYQKLVTDSFQTGFQPAIDSGNLTQKQVDALIKRMLKQPKALDTYLVIRPAKHAKATPTAVAN